MMKRASSPSPSTSYPIMSGNSLAISPGSKSASRGNGWCRRAARNHAFRSTRCVIERTTEGLALVNSMAGLTEFDQIAARDAARRAVEQIAVDDGAQLRHRQRVVAAHQVLDLEAAVLADGLQRSDDVGEGAVAVRERQQQPLIGDDAAIDVVDMGDGVGGQAAADAFIVDRHHQRREPAAEIVLEPAPLAGVTVGARHARTIAVDDDAWRLLRGVDREVHEVRKLVLNSRRLVLGQSRQLLLAGK